MLYKEKVEKQIKRYELISKNKNKFSFYMNIDNINLQLDELKEEWKDLENIDCISEECYNCSKKEICKIGIKKDIEKELK